MLVFVTAVGNCVSDVIDDVMGLGMSLLYVEVVEKTSVFGVVVVVVVEMSVPVRVVVGSGAVTVDGISNVRNSVITRVFVVVVLGTLDIFAVPR